MVRKRIEELRELGRRPEIDSDDAHVLRNHVINTLRTVFGDGSPEFEPYQNLRIYGSPMRLQTGFEDPSRAAVMKQESLRLGIEKTIKELAGIIRQLEDKKIYLSISTHDQSLDGNEKTYKGGPEVVINNYGFLNAGTIADIEQIKINVTEMRKVHADLAKNFDELSEAVQVAVLPEESKERALDCIGELTTELAKPVEKQKKWKVTEKIESLGKLLTAGANAYEGYEKVAPHLATIIKTVRSMLHV